MLKKSLKSLADKNEIKRYQNEIVRVVSSGEAEGIGKRYVTLRIFLDFLSFVPLFMDHLLK